MHRAPLILIALLAHAPLVATATGQSTAARAVPVHREPGHRLVFENELARVMEVRVAPGDTTGWHRHSDWMLGVVIAGARTSDEWAGQPPEPVPALTVGVVFDNGKWIPYTHRVGNVDTVAFHYIVGEVRRRSGIASPPLRAVAHLALERDTAGIRVYRITLASGEATTAHRHAPPGLTIQIGAGSVRAEGVKPQRLSSAQGPGAWSWHAAGHTHVLRNVGNAAVQLIEIDWP